MADAETSRLCVEIVHSHFGPLTASITDTLLARGRLPLMQLARFTQLKPRTVRACILVLVQHNILWHSVSDEDGEQFEVNVDEVLCRLRYGRYVRQAEELFGKAASDVVQIVLDHGKLRPPDIMAYLAPYDSKITLQYAQALHSLVSARYLKASTVLAHVSPRDKRIQYEAEEKAKISGFPTAKELREAKEVVDARLKRESEEAERIGLKKVAKAQTGKSSKRKAPVDEEEVDDEVYFRVNYDRFNVHIRNKLIESVVREKLNNGAATVMHAALKATEAQQFSLTDVRTDPATFATVAQHIPPMAEDDLSSRLILSNTKSSSSKSPSTLSVVKSYLSMLAVMDNPTPFGQPHSFVTLGNNKVQVEFGVVVRRLRQRVLESLCRERHGDEGVRMMRLLMESGKMNESQVGKVSMMAAKDIRPLLSAMSGDSFVSIQEVPRSADRNPSRMFYLWYVDLEKAYSTLLRHLFKALYNNVRLVRAMEAEPDLRAVLEKRERTDVSSDEALLTRVEREMIVGWEAKREKMQVALMRVEEAVFVVRDLGVVHDEES